MRNRARFWHRFGAALLLTQICVASPAAAQEIPADAGGSDVEAEVGDPEAAGPEANPSGFGGWSPALGIGVGLHLEEFNGSVHSSFGPAGQRKRVLSSLELRVDGRVLAPELAALPWRPRPFVHAGIGVPMRGSSTLLSESELIGPPNQSQGENRTEISIDWHLSWSAGAGLQFQLPIGYDVRLSPGLEYIGTRLGYGAAVSTRASPDPLTNPFPPRYVLEGSPDSFVRHFLGPSLAAEFVFLRVGPTVLSLFLDGRIAWNLGDRERRFDFSGLVSGVPQSGSARIESGRTVGRIGFGLRGGY